MRARLIALNPEPVDLPFDAAWQPRPFGHVACTVVETDDPEQLRLRLLEVASGGVVTGPLAEEPFIVKLLEEFFTPGWGRVVGVVVTSP